MRWLVVVVCIVFAPRSADAGGWYYKWSCSRACAPNELAIRGVSPAYASQAICEDQRWNDPRRRELTGPGNLGYQTSCEEYESEPTADDIGPRGPVSIAPMQRYSLAFVGGPGWNVRDAAAAQRGGHTAGVELNLVIGGRPWFGLETGIGVHRSPLTHPRWAVDAFPIYFIPWTLGFTSSPGIIRARSVEVRLEVGADIGFLFRTSCAPCDADDHSAAGYLWILRAGLDTYVGANKRLGIGVHGVMQLGAMGSLTDATAMTASVLEPPKFLLRLSISRRNGTLAW